MNAEDPLRRRVLGGLLAAPAALLPSGLAARRPATPACVEPQALTPRSTAGPFYTPDAPFKSDFQSDDPDGLPVQLSASVVTTRCEPVADAIVELWHADTHGRYDNAGFRLRGHQRCGADGHCLFRTVLPGRYPYRTRHFHLRLRAADGTHLLTTQLYFPNEPGNARDALYRPELLLNVEDRAGVSVAMFEFVVLEDIVPADPDTRS